MHSEPTPSAMRLTVFAEEPLPCDLLIDAREVYAVIETVDKRESGDDVSTAVLILTNKYKVVVFDKGRYVQKYWLKARGLSICKRGDAE